jgi:O-antigen ligase
VEAAPPCAPSAASGGTRIGCDGLAGQRPQHPTGWARSPPHQISEPDLSTFLALQRWRQRHTLRLEPPLKTPAAGPEMLATPDTGPQLPRRTLLPILQLGLFTCAVAVMAPGALGGDAAFLPKEAVLHLTAFALVSTHRDPWPDAGVDLIDLALLSFILVSAAGLLTAVSPWLGVRTIGISISSVVIYWSARSVAASGERARLIGTVAGVAGVVAAIGLLEAYGAIGGFSRWGRAPGGTFGNRNHLAHFVALAAPCILWSALLAVRRFPAFCGLAVLTLASWILTLSRARAAWLALLVAAPLTLLLIRRGGTGSRIGSGRAGLAALAACIGLTGAVFLPNRLPWLSATPYRDSVSSLVEAGSGSGRGRAIQYANTFRMARDHPVLGVGAGNWLVHYPRYAQEDDPSLDPRSWPSVTRFPQGDLGGGFAERGFPAMAFLLFAFAMSACRSARQKDEPCRDAAQAWAIGTLFSVGAVILLLEPLLSSPSSSAVFFLAWGALAPPTRPVASGFPGAKPRRAVHLALIGTTAALVMFGGTLLSAAILYRHDPSVEKLALATRIHPVDFRSQRLLAVALILRGDCERAATHIEKAARLVPHAAPPVTAAEAFGCALRLGTGSGGEASRSAGADDRSSRGARPNRG